MLNVTDQLIDLAIKASKNTYSPYSHYAVGVALLSHGNLYYGTNIENDSFGLTMCAERSALFSAISNGSREFDEMAVVTKDGGTSCGACRQVILQFCKDQMPIHFCAVQEEKLVSIKTILVKDLLPHPFRL